MIFLAIMDQRFELETNEIVEIKQKLISALKRRDEVSFAYLHGSFGIFPFRDIDIGAYCSVFNSRS